MNPLHFEIRPVARRSFVLTLLLLLCVCGGCKKDATVATEHDPVGTYTLVSVDGEKVPCTVKHEGHTLAVKSGVFVINADATCSSKVSFSGPQGGEANREVKATYTRQGSKLTMRWEGAGTTVGTVQGDTFTMNNEGMVFFYQR